MMDITTKSSMRVNPDTNIDLVFTALPFDVVRLKKPCSEASVGVGVNPLFFVFVLFIS